MVRDTYKTIKEQKAYMNGRQDIIEFLECDGVITHTGSKYYLRYLVDHRRFDDRWFTLKGRRTLEEELGGKSTCRSSDDDSGGGKKKSLTVQERYAKEEPEWERGYRIERAKRDRDFARKFTEDGHRKYEE